MLLNRKTKNKNHKKSTVLREDNITWKGRMSEDDEVQFGEIAEQVGSTADAWLLFSKYVDAVVQNCVQTILPKWESRLGGAEAFMPTHCFTMTQYGRVDPSVNAILQNSTIPATIN
jgi:hypothetical protein